MPTDAGAAKTGAGHAETIERWLALTPSERAAALPELRKIVLTGQGHAASVSPGQPRPIRDYESHAERLADADRRVAARSRTAARLAADMAAGLRAGQAFAAAYARAKRSAGVADFDDLIAGRGKLLASREWANGCATSSTAAPTISWSMNRRTPTRAQWEIVRALAEEYFSGSSEAEGRGRTIFMVGDFKQAIFGFQGTDPREFEREAPRCKRASELASRCGQPRNRRGARIPRPVDQRQLPLGASGARCGRRGHPGRRLSRDGPARDCRRSMSRTTPTARASSSCGSRSRWRIEEEARRARRAGSMRDARVYAESSRSRCAPGSTKRRCSIRPSGR